MGERDELAIVSQEGFGFVVERKLRSERPYQSRRPRKEPLPVLGRDLGERGVPEFSRLVESIRDVPDMIVERYKLAARQLHVNPRRFAERCAERVKQRRQPYKPWLGLVGDVQSRLFQIRHSGPRIGDSFHPHRGFRQGRDTVR
jgi:hypothetical protein